MSKPVLTDAQQVYLQSYVDDALPSRGLWDWEVTIKTGACGNGNVATTHLNPTCNSAKVFFSKAFAEDTELHQRQTILHELLHVLWRDPAIHIWDQVDRLGKRAYQAWDRLYERTIDRMAVALADTLPTLELPA